MPPFLRRGREERYGTEGVLVSTEEGLVSNGNQAISPNDNFNLFLLAVAKSVFLGGGIFHDPPINVSGFMHKIPQGFTSPRYLQKHSFFMQKQEESKS